MCPVYLAQTAELLPMAPSECEPLGCVASPTLPARSAERRDWGGGRGGLPLSLSLHGHPVLGMWGQLGFSLAPPASLGLMQEWKSPGMHLKCQQIYKPGSGALCGEEQVINMEDEYGLSPKENLSWGALFPRLLLHPQGG